MVFLLCLVLKAVHMPRPPEKESLGEIVVEQDGYDHNLDTAARLRRIRYHVLSVMVNGAMKRGSVD